MTKKQNGATLKVVFNRAIGTTDEEIDVVVTIVLPLDKTDNSTIATFNGHEIFKPIDASDIEEETGYEATVSNNIITITLSNVGSSGKDLDLSKCITTGLVLPTLADYNDFSSAMGSYSISISAAEAPAN